MMVVVEAVAQPARGVCRGTGAGAGAWAVEGNCCCGGGAVVLAVGER